MENIPFLLLGGLMLGGFFAVSFASWKFRLPSVLVYIILGIAAASLFHHADWIHITAEIGIVLLFFILGLEFPLARMVTVSKRIWPAGALDVGLNLGGAMGVALLFGLDLIAALTVGSIAYATSSSISAKLLDEHKRLANPEAEFILSLLIFEDLVAPVLVSFLAGVRAGDQVSAAFMGVLFGKILALTAGAVLIGLYGFRRLSHFVSKSLRHDFMPMLAVGLALGYAGLAVALGLSEILGAFLAGVMLSETGRSSELEHLLLPLRDLTLPFFFFWFGTTIQFGEGLPLVSLLGVLVLLAVVGKIVTAYAGGRWFGLNRKVALRAGFSMVQRGEFSAIIAGLASAQLRVFSGAYILATAVIGVFLFDRAPALAGWIHRRRPPPGADPSGLKNPEPPAAAP